VTRRNPVLSVEERRALAVLDAQQTQRHPELAAALSFGRPTVPNPGALRARRKRMRRVRRSALGVVTATTVAYVWLWSTTPPGPCGVGQDMTDRAALVAAADFSRPMPDNVGCVMPAPSSTRGLN
jgi:hypothetical protein